MCHAWLRWKKWWSLGISNQLLGMNCSVLNGARFCWSIAGEGLASAVGGQVAEDRDTWNGDVLIQM